MHVMCIGLTPFPLQSCIMAAFLLHALSANHRHGIAVALAAEIDARLL